MYMYIVRGYKQMKNVDLIFDYIHEWKVNISNNPIIINVEENLITSKILKHISSDFKYLLKYPTLNWEVILNFGEINFADKVTYLILDSLLYHMINNTRYKFKIYYKIDLNEVHNMGYLGTALYNSIVKNNYIDSKKFLEFYNKKYYANDRIYRRFITDKELKEKEEWPSIVCSEVASILKDFTSDEEWIDSISEIVSELVCNVASHTDGDCLIHIDISNTLMKNQEVTEEKLYSSINIAVVNFSENTLFDMVKDNIKNNRYSNDDLLYNRIYSAYYKHTNFFDEEYTEDHFFLITAFQNHVTSRVLKSGSGGTGLTKLIEKIINKTVQDYSYVLSGRNIIFFDNNCLKLSNEKFIGFNKENDYFNCEPAKEIIKKSSMHIPGSIYNLLLIKE